MLRWMKVNAFRCRVNLLVMCAFPYTPPDPVLEDGTLFARAEEFHNAPLRCQFSLSKSSTSGGFLLPSHSQLSIFSRGRRLHYRSPKRRWRRCIDRHKRAQRSGWPGKSPVRHVISLKIYLSPPPSTRPITQSPDRHERFLFVIRGDPNFCTPALIA